jgi:hypothetical protein
VRYTPFVAYHQLYLAPPEVWPVYDQSQGDRLVQLASDRLSLIVATGVAMGPVTLDVALMNGPDAGRDRGEWDESVDGEMDVTLPLYAFAPTIDTGVADPVFSPDRPGTYGFRLSARGRARHYDEVVETPVETYLLQFWAT